MRISVELNSIEELVELSEYAKNVLAEAQRSSFEPEDRDDEELEELDDCDTAGRARLTGTDEQWARIRVMAGIEGERAGQAVGAPNKKEYYIAPSKLADVEVYMRVAQELGEFGPKFFRDRWQEIKAMYQTYKDEGVPGRRKLDEALDVVSLRELAESVKSIDVNNIVSEVATNDSCDVDDDSIKPPFGGRL